MCLWKSRGKMAQSHTTNNIIQTKVNTLETILTLIDNLRAEVHSLVDDVCATEGNNKEGMMLPSVPLMVEKGHKGWWRNTLLNANF